MPDGLNSDSNFERTFADLASAVLQDRSPALLEYLMGFQVLDVNDDQTKAVGVFGCKVGNELIYLPVFFMNGELKGSELMYLKNQDLFCPSSESWVSYLLNRKPYKFGETSRFTQRDLSSGGVDLMPFRASPENYGKAASYVSTKARSYLLVKASTNKLSVPCWNEKEVQEWTKPFVVASAKRVDSEQYKQAAANLDLTNVLSNESPKVALKIVKEMTKNASFGEAILRYYPIEVLTAVKPKMAKQAESPVLPDVRILSYNELSKWDNLKLNDSEKSKLMKGEIVIKDHRDNTSKVFKLNMPMRLQSIQETGIYEIPLEDGDLVKAFILVNGRGTGNIPECVGYSRYGPRSESNINRDVQMINLDGTGVWNGKANDLFGRPITCGKFGFASQFADMSEVKSMSVGSRYCIVSPSGTGVQAFRVASKSELEDGSIQFSVSEDLEPYHTDNKSEPGCGKKIIIVLNNQSGSIEMSDRTLYVGGACRALAVKIKERGYDDKGYLKGNYVANYGMVNPASKSQVERLFWRNGEAVPLKLYTNGTEFQITVGETDKAIKSAGMKSYRAALQELTYTYGIQGDTAQAMLKEAAASHNKAARYAVAFGKGYPSFFKKANDPYLTPGNITAPALPGSDGMGNSYDSLIGAQMQTPMFTNQSVPGMRANMGDYNLYNPNPQLDNNPYQALQSAAQTGQKEIFDTAMIGALVNTSDNDKLIDKYVGDLILGMDRVGRIYFLYLQHNDKFEERYGQEDMLELEDNLRDTFNSLGNLVMFLKQKTVENSAAKDRTKIEL